MHNYSSKVEVVGQVMSYESRSGCNLLRLLYRDERSPSKFVNVFIWNGMREKVDSLGLMKGDNVRVTGELAFMENAREKHGIRLTEINRVGPTAKMAY